jgi:hypothetical protein
VDQPRRDFIEELLAAQDGGAVRALMSPLARPADRTEPAGREWLKQWGPTGLTPKLVACTCRTGTCRICN